MRIRDGSLPVYGALLSVLFAALASGAPPVRIYVELEDGDGLACRPCFDESVKGWYAVQANCRGFGAPGGGFCAVLHEGAPKAKQTLTVKLAKPLPAGKYRLFLRGIGPLRQDPEASAVRVTLGGVSAGLKWSEPTYYFVWLANVEVTTTEPTREVTLTPIRFGRNRPRIQYEPRRRTFWLDTLYITGDLAAKTPPDLETETAIKAGRSAPAMPRRSAYRADEIHRTPLPEGEVRAEGIRLVAFDGRRNLWPNSSFELGMNDGWAGTQPYAFSDKDLDAHKPFHGNYSLRVPKGDDRKTLAPGEPGVRRPPRVKGIYPFSRPYYLAKGGRYCISLYARGVKRTRIAACLKRVSSDPNAYRNVIALRKNIKKVLVAAGALDDSWRRFHASGDLEAGWYYLSIESPGPLWVDAVQLEAGAAPTPYAPRAVVEGALRTGQYGNTIYDDQRTLTAWVHNSGEKRTDASIRYRLVDVRERVVAEGTTPAIAVGPGRTVQKELPVLPALRGVFSATYALRGRDLPEGETAYAVLPAPATGTTRHEFGVNTSLHPVDVAIHARMGVKWILTCKTPELGAASYMHPKPDQWKWWDRRVDNAIRNGFRLHPGFWCGRLPAYMRQDAPPGYRPARNEGMKKFVPNAAVFNEHAVKVAGHYKGRIGGWNIDDEVSLHWDPALFSKVVNSILDSMDKAHPNVGLDFSATPEYTEEMLRSVKAERLAAFSGSNFDFQYWQSRYCKRLKDQYSKPYISYGVGARAPAATMYHTLYTYKPVRWKAAWGARQMINMYLLQDLDVAGHYSGWWRNAGDHLPGDKPLVDYDGTPLPWGGTLACMARLLADAELLDDVPLGKTGRRAYVFRIGERLGAVTWATCVQSYDHHWKPARRMLPAVSLPCAEDSLVVQDMYFNDVSGHVWKDGRLVLDLGEEPTFLMSRSLGRRALIETLEGATAPSPEVAASFTIEPGPDRRPVLRVTVRNGTDRTLEGLTLDMRVGGHEPMSTSGMRALVEPFRKLGDVPAAASRYVTVPLLLHDRFPLEDGYVRAYLRSADGSEFVSEDRLWILQAPQLAKPPEIDGSLDAKQVASAGWLYYDYSWALLGRGTIQLQEGGEYFGYPPYTVQARAAIVGTWDDKNLYIGIRLQKNQPMLSIDEGDSLRVRIAPQGAPRTDLKVAVGSGGAKGVLVRGRTREPIDVKTSSKGDVTDVEIVVPWERLSATPEAGQVVGFDVFWTDVHKLNGKPVRGTMRWAGGSNSSGYLLLKPPAE